MNSLQDFKTQPFINALKAFFNELKVPVNYLVGKPGSAKDILGDTFKPANERNPKEAILKLKTEGLLSEKYNFDNFDLITWLIIS